MTQETTEEKKVRLAAEAKAKKALESKPNRYDEAAKELEGLKKGLSESLVKEIKPVESGYFHTIGVQIIQVPNRVENRVKLTPHIFDKLGMERHEKRYAPLHYSKVIIVHDPTKQA